MRIGIQKPVQKIWCDGNPNKIEWEEGRSELEPKLEVAKRTIRPRKHNPLKTMVSRVRLERTTLALKGHPGTIRIK